MSALDRAELGVLLEACRRWLEIRPGGEIPGQLDWRRVGRLGFFHNLEPLLYRLAEQGRLPGTEIPAEVLATWESAHYRNFLFNSRALELLERLAGDAADAGMDCVAFKGPVTLTRAYGDAALRVMVDLDLLLRRSDLEGLGTLAGRLGFATSGRDHTMHAILTHAEAGLGMELHFDIYDFLLRRDELVERVLRERVMLRLDGRSFPAPPPELALVLETAHLVQDDFRVDLRHWLDLAALLSKAPADFDWQALETALRGHGVLPELLLALEVTAELFGLPPTTVPFFRPSGYPRRARRRVVEGLARIDRGRERPALQELAYRSGIGAKLSYLGHRLLPTGGRLRALAPGRGIGAALATFSRQSARTAARELGRWRSSGVAPTGDSVKARVYARNGRRRSRAGSRLQAGRH